MQSFFVEKKHSLYSRPAQLTTRITAPAVRAAAPANEYPIMAANNSTSWWPETMDWMINSKSQNNWITL